MSEAVRKDMDFSDFEQKAAELAASFTYNDYKIVRSELFAHMRRPSVMIRYDSITFNASCINGLEGVVYIQFLISENQKRIAIRSCNENDKDAVRWCVVKEDKRKSRKITCRDFTKRVFEMMGWDTKCRYKLVAYKIPFDGQEIYVFELKEPEIFHERPRRTNKEWEEIEKSMSEEELAALKKEETANSRKPFYPDDVENTFGLPVNEHEDKVVFADPESYQRMEPIKSRTEHSVSDNGSAVTDTTSLAGGSMTGGTHGTE